MTKKPKKICETIVKRVKEKGMSGKITGGTNWFNRRNKAIISGLKL
jgi:SOS-response transcriptional repressor LexA